MMTSSFHHLTDTTHEMAMEEKDYPYFARQLEAENSDFVRQFMAEIPDLAWRFRADKE